MYSKPLHHERNLTFPVKKTCEVAYAQGCETPFTSFSEHLFARKAKLFMARFLSPQKSPRLFLYFGFHTRNAPWQKKLSELKV